MNNSDFLKIINDGKKQIKNEKLFFVDKYSPIQDEKVGCEIFDKKVYSYIDSIKKCKDFPHILIYGTHGSGKSTLAKYIIQQLFGKNETRTYNRKYITKKNTKKEEESENSKSEVILQESLYHIELDMRIYSKYDKFLTQNIIVNYSSEKTIIDVPFRVVLIYGCELISHFSQTALRGTIEKYSENLRFIMVTRNISQIFSPIRSRLHSIKVTPPLDKTIYFFLKSIIIFENITISDDELKLLVVDSERNIKNALWKLQIYKYRAINNTNRDITYIKAIHDIIYLIINNIDLGNVYKIEEILYLISTTNINESKIIIDIMKILLKIEDISEINKKKIIYLTSETEYKLQRSNRKMLKLNEYVIKMLNILSKKNKNP